MRISDPGKGRRFATASTLLFILSILCGCALLKAKTEPSKSSDKLEQEFSEIIPPEPPQTEEMVLPDRKKRKGTKSKSYEVDGKTYYPMLSADGYEERGIASWYGPSFHGRRTSCGELFDMHKISAAHKLLPMYTHIEVTNLENGKSLTLTVNDRGPFVQGRVLDLSYAAAKSLGMLEKGLARVLVRTSGQVRDQKNNDILESFFVHIGSFKKESDAKYLIEDMKSLKYKTSNIKVIKADREGEILWRVELGPYKSMTAANKVHAKTIKDYPSAFVVGSESIRTANK